MQLRIYQLKRTELISQLLINSRVTSFDGPYAHFNDIIAFTDIQGGEDMEIPDSLANSRLATLEQLVENTATGFPVLALPKRALTNIAKQLVDAQQPQNLVAYSETCRLFRKASQAHRDLLRTVFLKINDGMTVNDDMINFLKSQGVLSVSLFINHPSFREPEKQSIEHVIETLKSTGIAVQRVITPADYVWHIDSDILKNFYTQTFKFRSEKAIKLISNDVNFTALRETLENPAHCSFLPGIAFAAVSSNPKEFREHAFHAQTVLPKVCPALHKNPEDYLVEHFMRHYGKQVSQLDIVEFNDGEPVSTTYIKNGERAFRENRSKCVIC